ncbi:MAG TPA: hypothetical protein VGN90_16770 [Pyrinomonadaceae bacterium]|jgi:hypothetical protein|nr:hypothetical protein [Pyrinomonadaceae bacterium]
MMKIDSKLVQRVMCLLALAMLLAGTVFDVSAQTKRRARRGRRTAAKPVIPYYTVPADTVIRVRLNEQLNSGTARVGDRFSANVTEPVYAGGGVEVIPVGSKVWGHVTVVNRAQKRKPGNITVAFNSVQLPNGRTAAINGSLSTLQADNVNADNEGTVKGRSNKKRDAVFIGGGAATGAIIGAIAGGGKGAAIGGILGGALGTGARVFEKEKEADVKSGTEFGVILNRSVSLPASTVR